MSTLIIRGATIDAFTSYCAKSGKREIEITCEGAWTDTVCESMGWINDPAGFGNGKVQGELDGISMMAEPNGTELKDYRFDIAVETIGKFRHIAKMEEGEVSERRLGFKVTTQAEDAHLVLDKWLEMVGPSAAKAQIKINYNAEEQPKLSGLETPANSGETPANSGEPKKRGRRKAAAE